MPEILQEFPINAEPEEVFAAVSTPAGLDLWWTLRSSGTAQEGAAWKLDFGPEYNWRAVVTRCVPAAEFELEITDAHEDWLGSRVGFVLEGRNGKTNVKFHHTGWPEANTHYRISCHCWALYLRILRRYVEHGETVPYEGRLDA